MTVRMRALLPLSGAFLVAFAATSALRAETSVQIEAKADQKVAAEEFNLAEKLYRQAGERRLEEAAVYEEKKNDLEIAAPGDSDDELDLTGSAESRRRDALAENYICAASDFEKGARPRQCDACIRKAEAVKDVSKKVLEKLADLRKFIAKNRDASEREPPPKPVRRPFKRPEGKLAERTYASLETFPKGEAETAAPKTLADLGVVEKRTVIAGEIDWNAEDATECVEEALASGATTIVFENHGSPWYVQYIRPRSNQRLLFKKGVRIYMDKVSCQNKDKSPLLQISGVKNVIIEGEGGPNDVVLAKFPDRAARARWQPEEGGNGIEINSGCNIVIRNLTSSWNSCDGVGISGWKAGASEDVWIENCIFANNYRQGMSVGNCAGLYCRNVSFLDTFGGEPMCGVDLEPSYDGVEATSECYFYDCTFGGNVGGAINWSAGGAFPVTAHLKRCRFLPAPTTHQICISARWGRALQANVRQPGRLVFEDCDMEVNTATRPIAINNANAFDIDIRGLRVKNVGPRKKDVPEKPGPAIYFRLGGSFRRWGRIPDYDFANEGRIRVEGLVVEGFGPVDPVGFGDDNGSYSVTNISGTATVDGKKWDLSQFHYDAPEIGWGMIEKFDPKNFLPPKSTQADTPAEIPVSFTLSWTCSWFDPPFEYRALYFEDGEWKMKMIRRNVRDLDLEKLPVAYYCRGEDSRIRMRAKKDGPATVYFELPAGGRPCTLKFHGNAILRNPKGETVGEFRLGKRKYIVCTPSSEASEIWSLTIPSDVGILWFFPPMTGIVAENPDWLPRHR